MPDQLKLPFALWTTRAVRDLIEQRFGKRLGLATVQPYLQRWGLSPQKPLARARERAPTAIAAWLERDYPEIARRAKAERAAIDWGDDTGIYNQDQSGRTRAPRNARRPRVGLPPGGLLEPEQSLISAVSNRGLMRFMFYDGALNAERFLAFLQRLVRAAEQKVFLIALNLRVHHAKRVEAWLTSHAHAVELFDLPSYAPKHNLDEYLNSDLKQMLRQAPQPGSKDDMIKNTRAALRAIQRRPARVRGYFRPAAVQYAA